MSDITKEELKKEIAAILKGADLTSTSSKKVRQEIAEKLDIDLSSRRKEIDELVMEYIEQDKSKSKKNGKVEDDDDEEEENDDEEEDEEEEEEVKKPKRGAKAKKATPVKRAKAAASSEESEDASDDEGDDEYSPKKKTPKKAAAKRGGGAAGRKKNDSDEDWGKGKKKRSVSGGGGGGGSAKKAVGGKRGGGGYTKSVTLSPELAAIMGEDSMPRHEVVKRVWAIIKERNLYDPKNKQFAICDDELMTVFGIKRFRTFGMMKFLKNHFRDN